MSDSIDIFGPLEVENIPVASSTSPAVVTTVNITGWSWWMLVSAQWTVNNLGGALALSPLIQLDISNVVIWTLPGTQDVAAGATNLISAMMFATRQTVVGGRQALSLGFLPVDGEARLSIGGSGGDANTVIQTVMITILGRRRRNRPK